MMKFDYGKKKWGTGEVDLNPQFLGATRLKYALMALKAVPRGRVLEVGCGGGSFPLAIKKHRPELEIVGIDISQEVLTVAKKKKGEVRYQWADVYQLPFKDESFEAVVSFDVWEHLEKPEKAFQEAFRTLKPGGIFHFFVPTEGNSGSLYQLFPQRAYQTKQTYTGHLQAYKRDELFNLLSQAGFKIKKYHLSCFYFYQLIDLIYFIILGLRRRNTTVSVEGYLQFAQGNLFDKVLAILKNLFGWLTYLENEIFRFLPAGMASNAGGIHITAVRDENS